MSLIRVKRGDDAKKRAFVLSADRLPQDVAGWAFTFSIKRKRTDTDLDALWQGTLASGAITVVDEALGALRVKIPRSVTGTLPLGVALEWDLQAVDVSGDVGTLDEGKLIVTQDVTKA